MRALNQQLTTFNSMTTKDQVRKSIAETYQKLLEARAEAVKAKEALEKFINQAASARTVAPLDQDSLTPSSASAVVDQPDHDPELAFVLGIGA